MQLTRETVARKLAAYLHHEIPFDDLVSWANAAMMEADFEEAHYDTIRDAVARLGLADVRAFGLTWEDCQSILKQLGYDARVEIVAV
jgi:cobyrinic acid a,c-diamide synthase